MNQLPTDMYHYLFSFLNAEVLGRCSQVCKKWRLYSTHNAHWLPIYERRQKPLPSGKVSDDYYYLFESFTRNIPNLKRTTGNRSLKRRRIDDSSVLRPFIECYPSLFPQLHALHFNLFTAFNSEAHCEALQFLTTNCTRLEHVNLCVRDLDKRVLILAIGMLNLRNQGKIQLTLSRVQITAAVRKVLDSSPKIHLVRGRGVEF